MFRERILMYNKFDHLLIIFIGALVFGAVGGGLQVIRLISLVILPSNIWHILSKSHSKSVIIYLLLAIFWFIYIIAMHWTSDIEDSKIWTFYLIIHFNIVYTIIRLGCQAAHPEKSLVLGWLAFIVFGFIYAVFEIVTDHHLYTASHVMELQDSGIAINGVMNKKYAALTFNNPNEYMTALSFGAPYLFAALLIFKQKKQQIFLWGIVFIYFFIVMQNASRGAILTFVVCCAIFLHYYRKISFPAKKDILTFVIVISTIGLLVMGNMIFNQLRQRIDANTEILHDIGRMEIYRQAFLILQNSGYMGIGPGGFKEKEGFMPHNLFLEIFGEYGWIVFSGIVCVLLSTIVRSFKLSKGHIVYRAVTMMVFCSLPIISIINSGYLSYPFLWVAIGSVFLLKEIYRKKSSHSAKFSTSKNETDFTVSM